VKDYCEVMTHAGKLKKLQFIHTLTVACNE